MNAKPDAIPMVCDRGIGLDLADFLEREVSHQGTVA